MRRREWTWNHCRSNCLNVRVKEEEEEELWAVDPIKGSRETRRKSWFGRKIINLVSGMLT